jgi:hypothetical protein
MREEMLQNGEFYVWLNFLANIAVTTNDTCYWKGCNDPSMTLLQQESPVFGNRELRFCWHHYNHVRDFALEVMKGTAAYQLWPE